MQVRAVLDSIDCRVVFHLYLGIQVQLRWRVQTFVVFFIPCVIPCPKVPLSFLITFYNDKDYVYFLWHVDFRNSLQLFLFFNVHFLIFRVSLTLETHDQISRSEKNYILKSRILSHHIMSIINRCPSPVLGHHPILVVIIRQSQISSDLVSIGASDHTRFWEHEHWKKAIKVKYVNSN